MDCIICTDEVTNEYIISKSCKCKYPIHEKCYIEWKKLNINKTCLICRSVDIGLIYGYTNLTRNQNNRSVLPQRSTRVRSERPNNQSIQPSAPPADVVVNITPSAPPADVVVNVTTITENRISTVNLRQPNYHWRSRDPYEVLAINNNATNDQIHQSFMFLMNVYKPSNFSSNDTESLRICEEAIGSIYRAYINLLGRNYRSMRATITYPEGLSAYMAEINNYETRQNRFCNYKHKRLIMLISFSITILGIVLTGILLRVL